MKIVCPHHGAIKPLFTITRVLLQVWYFVNWDWMPVPSNLMCCFWFISIVVLEDVYTLQVD